MYKKSIGWTDNDAYDEEVGYHFTVLVSLASNEQGSSSLIELDGEPKWPYIRGISGGNSLSNGYFIREFLKEVAMESSHIVMFKMVRELE